MMPTPRWGSSLVVPTQAPMVDCPSAARNTIGPITFRAVDGQSTMGAWVGTTKIDTARGVGIMVNHEYVPGEKVLPSDDEVKKMRSGS